MNDRKNLKKKLFTQGPKLVLAALVLGFCLLVGISSLPLLADGLQVLDPAKPETWGAALKTIDAGYAQGLLSGSGAANTLDPTQSRVETMDEKIKSAFVDMNGLATGALGQRELNAIVKLDNGYITAYLNEKQDLTQQVAKTVEFSQFVQQQEKHFVFVMAPHLINKYNAMLPAGVVDYFNQMADEFLQALAAAGVSTMDLREMMYQEGFDHYGGFFRTDHHWTPQAASWANDRVMRQMNEWGWLNTADLSLTPDSFAVVPDGVRFYGTAAERTGEAFAGTPDTLYSVEPTAEVSLFTKRYDEEQFSSPVPFAAVYRDWQYAEYDRVYGPDAYYLYKTSYEMNVLNETAPADNSMMLICDSFGVPFQSFASCYVRQLTSFDGRQHPDLSASVEQSDIVMVLFNPSSLDIRTENQTIFNFR